MSDLKDPRVLFAAERTLPAWNRTSLSLIAFGFAVERAGVFIQGSSPSPAHDTMTFWLGVLFSVLGAMTSAYSARQYAVVLSTLGPAEFPPGYAAKWGLVVNYVVAVLGAGITLSMFVGRQ